MHYRLLNHFLFWTVYVCFKAFLNYAEDEPLTAHGAFVLLAHQTMFLLVKVPLVYGSFYAVEKYMDGRWSLAKLIALLTAAFVAGSYGMFKINIQLALPILFSRQVDVDFGITSLVYYFFTLLFVVGLALSIHLFRKQYKLKLHDAWLEKEKTDAELRYLKSQINPHFLFNTLNNIYSLARKGSDKTAESVMKLAALMRFMLYESASTSIPLKAELKIIADYIELEKLRYSDRLRVKYVTEIDNPEQPIAPLLLIHFVENAFKHGAGESRAEIEVRISISLRNRLLSAEFSNPIGEPRVSEEPVRIGMENTKRQLSLLYPAHQMRVHASGAHFTVSLTIPLNRAVA